MLGMMQKGLFNFIIAVKGAHDIAYASVKITDNDVIRKDGRRGGDEMGGRR